MSVKAGDFIRRERDKENREVGGVAVDVLAVSMVVPIWIFNVSTLELVSASQIPAVRQSASPVVMVKASLYKQELELLALGMYLQRNCQCVTSFYQFVSSS